jgi:hypothetical protein
MFEHHYSYNDVGTLKFTTSKKNLVATFISMTHPQAAFWDARYQQEDFVYGTAPNRFLAEQLAGMKPGKILFPLEGEGRNAVYAASLGWEVDCFDFSQHARNKALSLAASRQLTINYQLAEPEQFNWPNQHYDCIGLFYAHLPEKERQYLHKTVMKSLEIGGILLLEAFDLTQLGRTSGGPKDAGLLYSTEILEKDFAQLRNRRIERLALSLDEGPGHQGEAVVLRMAGMR